MANGLIGTGPRTDRRDLRNSRNDDQSHKWQALRFSTRLRGRNAIRFSSGNLFVHFVCDSEMLWRRCGRYRFRRRSPHILDASETAAQGDPRTHCWRLGIQFRYSGSRCGSYPFWEDVELGNLFERMGWTESKGVDGVSAIYRRGTGEYIWPKWNTIGPFIKEVRTAKQCGFVLEVLHENWFKERLTSQQCIDVVRQVRSSPGLPLNIKRAATKYDSMSGDCVLKDGVWLSHFGMVEGASLVEYKYAISSEKGLARMRRVLVEGPDDPFYCPPDRLAMGLVGDPDFTKQGGYELCRHFLLFAAHCAAWKNTLANGEVRERLPVVIALYDLAENGRLCDHEMDVVPQLQKAVLGSSGYVWWYAAPALRLIDHQRLIQSVHANLASADKRRVGERLQILACSAARIVCRNYGRRSEIETLTFVATPRRRSRRANRTMCPSRHSACLIAMQRDAWRPSGA